MVQSALLSAERAEEIGLPRDRSSCRPRSRRAGSDRGLSRSRARSDYALHLGLTEAGMGSKGIVASSAALGILLQQGIGDTIRVSLTPEPGGDRTRGEGRAGTAADHGLPHLRAAGRRLPRLRPHHLDRVPGTGREIQDLRDRMPEWKSAIPASRRSTSR
jgi:(E)-4-hydroxy-3-methylbut-2-enyl-diphosphate synthase